MLPSMPLSNKQRRRRRRQKKTNPKGENEKRGEKGTYDLYKGGDQGNRAGGKGIVRKAAAGVGGWGVGVGGVKTSQRGPKRREEKTTDFFFVRSF